MLIRFTLTVALTPLVITSLSRVVPSNHSFRRMQGGKKLAPLSKYFYLFIFCYGRHRVLRMSRIPPHLHIFQIHY